MKKKYPEYRNWNLQIGSKYLKQTSEIDYELTMNELIEALDL